jgi:ABC transporter with metal-binding/Fe-S-binding domain ATP-binding protein
MKVAALFSGGKDSIYSIYIAQQWGWDITQLITLDPLNKDSWMFHTINIDLTKILSHAVEIPLLITQTEGKKEKELEDLKYLLKNLEIEGIISGTIASEYQRTRIEKICHELKIKSFTPIWHKDQKMILEDMIKAGFKIIIVGIFAYGLDEKLLGKTIDYKTIHDLTKIKDKYMINMAGEGGEYETFTIDGPIFKKKLIINNTSKELRRDSGILKINKVHLE